MIDNSGGASLSVYVASCLTFGGSATIVEPPPGTPTLNVYVGGLLDMGEKGSAMIGTATNKILTLTAVGGCKWHKAMRTCSNGADSQIWAQTYSSAANPQPLPTADPNVVYAKANWNAATCATGVQPFDNDTIRNGSKGNVDLLGLASFDCTAKDGSGNAVGRLAWNFTTKSLTATGPLFIDGNLVVGSNRNALYTAGTSSTIYVNGTVTFSNDGAICGPGPGSAAVDECSNEAWDPNLGELLIWSLNTGNVVPAVDVGGNAALEGGIYANGKYFGGNGAFVRGPVLAKYGEIDGDGKSKAFITVPGGASGGAFTLGNPHSYG